MIYLRSFFLKVNGKTHCPRGISSPDLGDWVGGSIKLPIKGIVTARDSGPVAPIESGDKLWVWTHETKRYGDGVGLAAWAIAGNQIQVDGEAHVALKEVSILPRKIGKKMYQSLTTAVDVIDYSIGYSHDRGYLMPILDEEKISELVAERDRPILAAQRTIEDDRWRAALEKRHEGDNPEVDRIVRQCHARPGQAKFRREVFDLYDASCILSGCKIRSALDAAHVVSHNGDAFWDQAENGIPLRRDLHGMFDAFLWSIDPATNLVSFAQSLSAELVEEDPIQALDGMTVRHRVPAPALAHHFSLFKVANYRE